MGLTSLGLSWHYRMPVLTAWSTPGAALHRHGRHRPGHGRGVGAFIVCALLITLAGATGWFARVMDRIPQSLAAALLAGVLARFAFDAFAALPREPAIVGAMCAAFLAGRRWWPRFAVPGVLAVGVAMAAAQGRCSWGGVLGAGAPVFTMPSFSLAAVVGLALPLFVVTMASQNLPGVAAQRAAGYAVPVSPAITTTGRGHAAAGALRRLRAQPGGHHRGHLHGAARPRPTRRAAGGRRRRPGCSTSCSACWAARWWR
jgi:benzoate membrane transport protein